MLVKVKGILLDVIEKEYNFEGKSGVTCKALVYSEGRIQQIKVPRETVQNYKNMLNKEVSFDCSIFINGKYNLTSR